MLSVCKDNEYLKRKQILFFSFMNVYKAYMLYIRSLNKKVTKQTELST